VFEGLIAVENFVQQIVPLIHVSLTHYFLVLPTAGRISEFVLLFIYIFICSHLVIAVDSSHYQPTTLNLV
jgi:hypothetical protein